MTLETRNEDSRDQAVPRNLAPVWLTLLMVLIYPLSIGPAAWIYRTFDLRGSSAGTIIEYVYSPILWIEQNARDTWVHKVLTWWVDLWTHGQ